MSSGCIIVMMTDFNRSTVGPVFERIMNEVEGDTYFEIALVDTRNFSDKQSVDTLFLENSPHPYHLLEIEFQGYANSRMIAVDWVMSHRPGWCVMFVDDDDYPTTNLFEKFKNFHEGNPDAIIGARDASALNRKINDGMYPIETNFLGASYMFIPAHHLSNISSAFDSDYALCGGEDLQICLQAHRYNVELYLIGEFKSSPHNSGLDSLTYEKRKFFYHSWVFYSIKMNHKIFRARSRELYLLRNIFKCLILMIRYPSSGSLKLVSLLCAYQIKVPPARSWLRSKL